VSAQAQGGCECGAVRYRLAREPDFVNACHCRQCQRLTGSAFAINLVMPRGAVQLLAGRPEADGKGLVRCPDCLALLWATHPAMDDATLFVRAGTLDESERIVPSAHFFTRSKHPWIALPEGVPAYDTLPPSG